MDQSKLANAREYFLQGDYELSASLYGQLLQDNPGNPYLEINAANAFYKFKQYGKAITQFYKAKKNIPRDKILNENLTIVSSELQLEQPYLFSYQFLNFGESLLLLLVINLLFLVKARFHPWLKAFINVAFAVAIILAVYIGVEQNLKKHAVVTSVSTLVYSGDNESYTEMFELLDGQIIEIVREEDQWSQIQHKKNLGWIKREAYERI